LLQPVGDRTAFQGCEVEAESGVMTKTRIKDDVRNVKEMGKVIEDIIKGG
jgi:hypothetical protein